MTSDLSEVFGAPAVSGRLTGLRLPRVAQPADTASPAPAPPIAAPPAVTASPAPAAPPAAGAVHAGTTQITVYVLPHVADAIRADKRGRTNAEVVYDAIEAALDRLAGLLAAHRTSTATPAGGGLFARHRAAQPAAHRVAWTFKVTPANRDVLDRLAATAGASSRSELVAAVLEDAYPPPA